MVEKVMVEKVMVEKATIENEKATPYAVFGNPIAHSLSPAIHAQFAEQTQQAIHYQKQCIPVDNFDHAVRQFFAQGGGGLNITVPFKVNAFELVDQLTVRAKAAGAINTMWQGDDGQLWGDNTDGCGLMRDITENLGWAVEDKSVLVLGAGGAVRGILQPLTELAPKQIIIANRTPEKAQALAQAFSNNQTPDPHQASNTQIDWLAGGFDLLSQLDSVDVIINGTSASLGGDLPPLTSQLLHSNTQCYDMMYGAKPTVFLEWALANGCTAVSDGLGMLVEQAAEAFFLWRSVRPNTEQVIKAQRAGLS